MFTGLVEALGRVEAVERRGELLVLKVASGAPLEDLALGHSIALNGVCLTVTALCPGGFTVELVPETLQRSNLGGLAPGSRVNLERPLTPTTRMGGHFVQGHVEGLAEVVEVAIEGDPEAGTVEASPDAASSSPPRARTIRFRAAPELMQGLVPKGFVALDGVSLTIVDAGSDGFRVAYIPHTLANTIAGGYQPGDRVNLEPDILGKYVERFVAASLAAPRSEGPA